MDILNTQNVKRDAKKVCNFFKINKKDQVGIPPLRTDKGMATTNKNKAEALNRQYQSVFTKEDMENFPEKEPTNIPDMQDIRIDIPGVEKLLLNLKPGKACGPDQIPVRVMKEAAPEIAPALACIFQQSIDENELPDDWLKANIVPVYKETNTYQQIIALCLSQQ